MELQILFSKEQPKYVSIYEQIKGKIIQQQLSANEKLPSKRKLAERLNVSIQTVQNSVMIGFGAIPLKEIPSAIQFLAKSWLNSKECM